MTDPYDDEPGADAGHELISRLRVIEQQPLADRADAYAGLHDELARRLEAGVEGVHG